MQYLLTREEYDKLQKKEMELLDEKFSIKVRLKEIAVATSEFEEDLEYKALKRKLDYHIPLKLKQIKEKKRLAKIIEQDMIQFDGETVSIGTKVLLDYGDEKVEFSIMPINEIDSDNGIISCNSPIAKVILGKKKGDVVKFLDGTVTILEVSSI